ncbi:DEAD/DEAH box helicase [Candidatus Cyanaurora vandensis]|uniref:DEAD/DEAH box helicase n=1 Tax=Candidatus Cyanaurora vandensis TaxID=2714958 RepID=UPI00257AB7D1|nr:DEAD/DEAH box helicase [Candidatus Cyanaurora vandensis]
MSFAPLNLHPDLLRGVEALGFSQPTPIQTQAIPPALAGHDLLASAMTGTGKTAAFLLPILQRLLPQSTGTTRALVLTPTRELAIQIAEQLNQLAQYTPLRGATIIGGVAMPPQVRAFNSGVEVLIATPGRLLDHCTQPYAKLTGIQVLVFDEADRMLEMGFLPSIRRILNHLPRQRQTLFFSATMPKAILGLAREILHNPLTINQEQPAAPATGITQRVYTVAQDHKAAFLAALLTQEAIPRAIVFTRTKHRADRLSRSLTAAGIEGQRIHGNRSQAQRTQALEGFKRGEFRVLVTTDIAARGIDIEALGHVINFDVPVAAADYIHRVGRTARAERTGEAITLVAPEEEDKLKAIERALGKRLTRQTLPGFNKATITAQPLEIPLGERLAAHRTAQASARAKTAAKTTRTNPTATPPAAASRRVRPRTAAKKTQGR